MGWRAAATWVLVLLVARPAQATRPEWEAARGLRISSVDVQTNQVFDPTQPGMSSRVFRWANGLHATTRPQVVRREFQQEVGDPFNPRLAEECERNLRWLYLFQDARVRVLPMAGDSVRVSLYTVDRWTLDVSPIFKSQGGITELGLRVGERNLLGRGVAVGVEGIYSTDVSGGSANFDQRRFLGSFWELGFALARNKLGNSQFFNLTHPFYSDELHWSADLRGDFSLSDRRVFEAGEEVARFRTNQDVYEQSLAWHLGTGALHRWALFTTNRRVRGDVTSDIGCAGVAWSVLQRQSHYAACVDLLGPDEEMGAGETCQLGVGADLEALGAATDRPFVRADAALARFLGERGIAGLQLRAYGFFDHGSAENARAAAEVYGFVRTGARNLLAWRFGADGFFRDLPYVRFALGSDDRLRGYEARALNGTRVLYGSLEERLFTPHRILFAHLGAVVFVDVAAAWDAGETLSRDKAGLGAGLGFRLSGDFSGSSVTRVDFAFGRGSVHMSISSDAFFAAARALAHPPLVVFQSE